MAQTAQTNRKKIMVPTTMSKSGWTIIEARDDVEGVEFVPTIPKAEFHKVLEEASGICLGVQPFSDPELDAGQESARSERYEQMSRATPPSEVLADLHGSFSGDVVPDRESLAPAADCERSRREVVSADGGIGPVLACRRRRADGERRDLLAHDGEAPLAACPRPNAPPDSDARARSTIVVAVVGTEFL